MRKKVEVEAPVAAIRVTKKSQVLLMLRESSVSVVAIAEALAISKPAAYSLIGDLKRAGVAISCTMRDGKMHYSAVPPKRAKAKAATFGKGAAVSEAASAPTAAVNEAASAPTAAD
ncbi:winged helix-turn-helix domain-containing protein [Mesorhizobium australicum]|uniref:winged helix-turn-helix domain-containing protein n=1 Tax=Mesorhizobium australicum TaxID=536018 RepID=UPI00333947DD